MRQSDIEEEFRTGDRVETTSKVWRGATTSFTMGKTRYDSLAFLARVAP
jgi:hypothetical protein